MDLGNALDNQKIKDQLHMNNVTIWPYGQSLISLHRIIHVIQHFIWLKFYFTFFLHFS